VATIPITYSSPCHGGDSVLTREADAKGTCQLDDQLWTRYEPTTPWYYELQTLNSLFFNEPLFPMRFEPSNQAPTEDVPASHPTFSPAYVPSSSTPNISMRAPVATAVAPALTIGPPTPATNVTTRRRFGCPLCPKTFDRLARAEACHNEHLDLKPHVCRGVCGDVAW